MRTAQFVVELVGPRSVPAAQAAELARPDWHSALGRPELWAMAPADAAWQPLQNGPGSFDSVALAWDFVAPAGSMTTTSATHLLGLAERFANAIGRRAIPLTAPEDVPTVVRRLVAAQDGLDAGVTAILVAPRPLPVAALGRELEAMGLVPTDEEWAWVAPDHPEPLFAATPFDAPTTDGLTLGFRLARCPDPGVALEGLLRTADALAPLGLAAFDEDREPLTAPKREALRGNVRAASEALASVGLRPGSWAALKTFA